MNQSSDERRFLVLAPTGRDAPLTASLLARVGLAAAVCADIATLCREVARGTAALVIAEEALRPRALAVLGEVLERQPPWSDLPVILFTSESAALAARSTTPEVLAALGNVVLLDRPVRPMTMISAARAALRARLRQYAARDVMTRQDAEVRQRDQFLAMLGHELRNPLGAILLAAEILGGGEVHARQREIIMRQGQHLARLVDDLLDVARVTSGKVLLQRTTIELNELLEGVVAAAATAVAARRQSVSLRGASRAVLVEGDAVRLAQVFTNLLTNAVKYTPPGGHIVVTVEAMDSEVHVHVRDDGIGIAADMLPRVFELFAQAESSLDRAQGGLGVGLTLVDRMVALHGGRVMAASAGPGLGSEFTVVLPCAPPARDAAEAATPTARAEPAVVERRVVLIEDNADSRELMQRLLEGYGHRVETAENGEDGITRVLASRPDVVIVDIGLPKLDGYEVARRVREALGEDVLLIAVTGYSQPDDKRRAIEAGFDVHFAKPIDPQRLQRLLGTGKEYRRRREAAPRNHPP